MGNTVSCVISDRCMEPCSTPHPTKPPHPTMKPTKKKNSGGTYLTKAPKTPRPTTWKAPKPSKQPKTKGPKPTKKPKPSKAPKSKKSKRTKTTSSPQDAEMEHAEFEAFNIEVNGDKIKETFKPATVGYRGYVEIAGLISVAMVLMICLHSMCCQKRKEDEYAAIEDPMTESVI